MEDEIIVKNLVQNVGSLFAELEKSSLIFESGEERQGVIAAWESVIEYLRLSGVAEDLLVPGLALLNDLKALDKGYRSPMLTPRKVKQ